MKGSQGKHDRTLDDLIVRVKLWKPQSKTIPHFIYNGCEADALQYWKDECFHFNGIEVKCHDHEDKARQQLRRLEQYLHKAFKKEHRIVNSYYAYGCDGSYVVKNLNNQREKEFILGDYREAELP